MGLVDDLARLPEGERVKALSGLSPEDLERFLFHWPNWARGSQLAPEYGNDGTPWNTWLILAGRGYGKTRTGAEWLRAQVCGATPLGKGRCVRTAIVAETAKDARDVLVNGDSGLLAVCPKDFRPVYSPSKNLLVWPNGAQATIYNGTEPDQLRGPQFDAAWVDELAKYKYPLDAWDMLQFGLRLGKHPRAVVTTTPRPIPLVKTLVRDAKTAITSGSTFENAENLAESFLVQIRTRYEGTRLGRQELSAEILEDIPNALWRRSVLDEHRREHKRLPELRRVVVGVDPAAKAKENQRDDKGAETGIIVAGLGVDGRGYVLDDWSTFEGPNEWGRRAVAAYDQNLADRIVAEQNNGGDMVRFVIQSVRETVPVTLVTASRGKMTRAEPISALYEQGRISHVGTFPVLEDQMCSFTNLDEGDGTLKDRVDGLVWALSELFPEMVKVKKKKISIPFRRVPGAGWMG